MDRRTLVQRDNVAEALQWISRCKGLVVDTETTGLNLWHESHMFGVSVHAGGRSFYFPFRHEATSDEADNLDIQVLTDGLGPLLERSDITILNFHTKFDLHALRKEGVFEARRLGERDRYPVIEDSQIAAHLMNENEPSFELKRLADKYIDPNASADEQNLVNELVNRKLTRKNSRAQYVADKGLMARLPPNIVAPYAMGDVELALSLRQYYMPHLEKWGLDQIWNDVNDFALLIARVEWTGIQVDEEVIHRELLAARAKADEYDRQVRSNLRMPGLNLRSSKQLIDVFKSSTAQDVLEELIKRAEAGTLNWDRDKISAAAALREWRRWDKICSSYYEAYLKWKDHNDVIHTWMRVGSGPVSTRLSSAQPNLQAVPRQEDSPDAEAKRGVKYCFVPRPGYVLFEADYEQAELRMVAAESGEQLMISLITSGEDLHGGTAKRMSELLGRQVLRDFAKRMNFGVVYGLGVPGFAQNFRVPTSEAQIFVSAYHKTYPSLKEYSNKLEAYANANGCLPLWTGRYRHYTTSGCDCGNFKCHGQHKAMSNRIQGGVAELVRVAMLHADSVLAQYGVRILLQVHDSVVGEIPDDPATLRLVLGKNGLLQQCLEQGPDGVFPAQWPSCFPQVKIKASRQSWGHTELATDLVARLPKTSASRRVLVKP